MKQCPRSGLSVAESETVCPVCGDDLVPETALPDADFVRVQRMVRRLRWLVVGQAALFLYALMLIGAIVTLGMDDRWECWVLMPLPGIAMIVLSHWGRLVAAESPNGKLSASAGRSDAEIGGQP